MTKTKKWSKKASIRVLKHAILREEQNILDCQMDLLFLKGTPQYSEIGFLIEESEDNICKLKLDLEELSNETT